MKNRDISETYSGKTVLLVEDEALIALAEAQTIRGFGYRVTVVRTGEEAVRIAAAAAPLDLILMDIDLGSGIDGPQAAERILRARHIPIVFLTSHAEKEYVERVREITRYGYVLKNSGDFVLRSSIEMALELFHANESAAARERALEKTQSMAHMGSWTWEIGNDSLTWSTEMYRIFGYSPERPVGSFASVIERAVHPEDRERVARASTAVITDGLAIPLEYRVIRPDGSVRTIWDEPGDLSFDADGNPIRLTGYVQDITERTRIERELRGRETEYTQLVGSLRGILYSFSTTRGGLYYSPQVTNVLGYTTEEMLSRPMIWRESVHPDDRDLVNRAIDEVPAGIPYHITFRIRDARGNWRWLDDRFVGYRTEGPEVIIKGLALDVTEQMERDLDVRQGEAIHKAMIENISDVIAIIDSAGITTYKSPNVESRFGWTPEELIGSEVWRTIHPDDLERVRSAFQAVASQSGGRKSADFRFRCRDGSYRLITASAVNMLDDPEIGGILLNYHDITDRKRAEEELQRRNLLLTTILERAPIGFAVNTISDGQVVFLSSKFEAIYGVEPGSISGFETFFDEVYADADPEYREQMRSRLITDIESGDPSRMIWEDIHLPARNGATRYVSAMNIPVPEQDLMVSTVQDVTERVRAKESLRESEANLEAAQRIAKVGSWKWDTASSRLECSAEMHRILGAGMSGCDGSPDQVLALIHPDDRGAFVADFRALVGDGGPLTLTMECRIIHPDGSERHILTEGRTVQDSSGRTVAALGTVQDITERKRHDERIGMLLAEKALLLKEVHHRLKNNMSTMESLLSLHADSVKDAAAVTALQDARGRLHSMGVLYERLFTAENLQEMSIASYLPSLADEVVRMFPVRANLSLETNVEDFQVAVKELTSIGIITNELLTNAMKHAFEGRSSTDSCVITLKAVRREGEMIIVVEDNGVGLPSDFHIGRSTGFGFTVVEALTKQLRGAIKIEGGAGTRFVLTFPVENLQPAQD